MKKYPILALLFCTILLVSCKKEKTELRGEWLLVEVSYDPGDGSGSFEPVSSTKTLHFSNGSISSNGDLCSLSAEVGFTTAGTYNLADSIITGDCIYGGLPITFEHNGNELIVNYPYLENCRAKYVKQ